MTVHLSRRSLLRAAPALAVPVTLIAPLPTMTSMFALWRSSCGAIRRRESTRSSTRQILEQQP